MMISEPSWKIHAIDRESNRVLSTTGSCPLLLIQQQPGTRLRQAQRADPGFRHDVPRPGGTMYRALAAAFAVIGQHERTRDVQ
jgi:hypothetical protein